MNPITPLSDVISPLETHSHGYDDDERDAKQFWERYGLKLCGSDGIFLHEKIANLLLSSHPIFHPLPFLSSVTLTKSRR
jgi:predicted nucleic acid-binding protein